MFTRVLAMLVLAASGGEAINEPASPEDAAARKAYFLSAVKSGSIGPCKAFFPDHAASFDDSYARWLRENKALIDLGEVSIIFAAGPGATAEEFPVEAAERQITALLEELPVDERLPWCEQYF